MRQESCPYAPPAGASASPGWIIPCPWCAGGEGGGRSGRAGEDLTTTATPRTSRWGRRNCQKSFQLKWDSVTQGLEQAGGASSASHSATRQRRGHLLSTTGPRRTPPTQRQAEGLRWGAGGARGRRARSWERSWATALRRQELWWPSGHLQGENSTDGSRPRLSTN